MLQSIAISALVVIMMVTIGLELTLEDLGNGLREGKWLVLAVLANVVLVPALAYGLGLATALPAGILLGAMVCASAPGGPTGPLFTRIAGADLAFATALQVILCVIGLVSAPLTLTSLLNHLGESEATRTSVAGTPLWPMVRTLFVFQLVPLATGMLVRRQRPELAARMAKPMGTAANVLLLVIIVGMLATRGKILIEQSLVVHAVLVAMVVLPLALGRLSPSATEPQSKAMATAMVTTVRNLSVALLLSATFFEDPAVDAAILVWGFYMMLLPAGVAALLGRRARQVDPAPAMAD